MAGKIPQYFIDDLLARVNIVDVIESRVKLKRSGKNFSGLCPFHKENSPSFTVSPDKQFYYCFGCGAGGNALGFLMEYENLPFPDAVAELAKMAGLDVPRDENPTHNSAKKHKVKEQLNLLDQATAFYQQQLASSSERQKAIDYLQKRGLSDKTIQHFQIGFSPSGWDNLLKHFKNLPNPQLQLQSAGLVVHNEEKNRFYDRFRDRIMFPIRDVRGRVIAFGGRVLGDEKPKYLNSSETDTFHKSRELYGLYEARQATRNLSKIMIVEGYMDVVGLAQHGITWAVATLGTATTEQHLNRLFKVVSELIFCFDGDKAGRTAAQRALDISLPTIQDGQTVKFLFLPEGEDPDSLIRKEGQEAFEQRISQSLTLSEFFFKSQTENTHLESLDERAKFANSALPKIQSMKAGLLKQMMLERITELTGLSQAQLSSVVNLHQASHSTHEKQDTTPASKFDPYGSQEAYANYPDYPDYSDAHEPRETFYPKRTTQAPRLRLNLINKVISILLHRPDLAQSIRHPDDLGNIQDNNIDLLIELINYLKKDENNSLGTLLVDWQHSAQHSPYLMLLNEIANIDPIPAEANALMELQGAFQQLMKRSQERRLDQLLKKSKQTPLTQEEKARLQELLLDGHKKV
ncbi:DNA primase [Nitrincola tibetensis]|uniref:DNA primase n=1 Tax=Nitrincola tibetensis TaxID=2219697 RepID=A0A364NLD1_9GAMM|nr:DNA primase [Nitrincola tibetensis]RAU17918.1 DNA primase [Nitrincola tibetensis]